MAETLAARAIAVGMAGLRGTTEAKRQQEDVYKKASRRLYLNEKARVYREAAKKSAVSQNQQVIAGQRAAEGASMYS
jgi:hypothetical protein